MTESFQKKNLKVGRKNNEDPEYPITGDQETRECNICTNVYKLNFATAVLFILLLGTDGIVYTYYSNVLR